MNSEGISHDNHHTTFSSHQYEHDTTSQLDDFEKPLWPDYSSDWEYHTGFMAKTRFMDLKRCWKPQIEVK